MKQFRLNFTKCCCVIFYLLLSLDSFGQANVAKYEFFDGSANTYIITSDSIEYIPIEPSESATGTYDGGDPVLRKIDSSEYDTLSFIIQEMISDKFFHITDRMKTSGLIKVHTNDEINAYIISPRSELLRYFQTKLKEIIK